MSDKIFTFIEWLWGLYLLWRQLWTCQNTTMIPLELSGLMDFATFERSRHYSVDKIQFSMFKSTIMALMHFLVINYITFQYLLFVGSTIIEGNIVLSSMLYIFLWNTFKQLMTLPFDIYFNFVLEEKHGFNRQTTKHFIKDQAKSYILSQLGYLFITFATINIITLGGKYFYLYLWSFIAVCVFLFAFLHPDVFVPIFDCFTVLPTDLRSPLHSLCARVNFPFHRLKVLQASQRTAHQNAFMSGLFMSKSVVLWDTLIIDGQSEDARERMKNEVSGIVAHELGHWKLNHLLKMLCVRLGVLLVVMVVIFAMPSLDLFDRDPLKVVIRLYVLVVYTKPDMFVAYSFGLSWLSRNLESEADEFAASLGLSEELCQALVKLHNENLVFPVTDSLYARFHHTHPSLLERIQRLRRHQ